MKQLFAIAVLIVLLFGCASAQSSCSVSLNATRQATWFDNNSNHSLWIVVITAGSLPVSNVSLNILGDLAQFWEVVRVSGSLFRLPDWRIQAGGIPAGQSHVFGFIVNNADVNSPVSVVDTQCPNVSPAPSPSASASPAASASASPAASASASPTSSPTIVNTPMPSPSAAAGCALNVTQQPRSGAGGSWNDSTSNFQIYDLTLSNTGSRALSSASVTFAIAADQEITQFWNLNRVGTSNTFNFETFILPAVGTSQTGPGYVLRTPLNSTSAGSSIESVTANCSA